MPVQIKICGITRVTDALSAVEAGADYIGLVFYPGSRRCVSIVRAAEIIKAVPAHIQCVGLFVDANHLAVQKHLSELSLDWVQFHGHETNADIQASLAGADVSVLKAIRMVPDLDLQDELACFDAANAFLLDAYHPSQAGGTGECFDWTRFPQKAKKPLFLAGGLTSENVAEAIAQTQPFAVDVSSGVEESPGIKSVQKMKAFCAAVKGERDE